MTDRPEFDYETMPPQVIENSLTQLENQAEQDKFTKYSQFRMAVAAQREVATIKAEYLEYRAAQERKKGEAPVASPNGKAANGSKSPLLAHVPQAPTGEPVVTGVGKTNTK